MNYTSYSDQYVTDVLSKLKLAMKHYNITSIDGFFKLDANNNFTLSVQEFGTCLKQIDPTITAYEISIAYNRFDTNKSGSVDYTEFYTTLDKIQLPAGANYQTQEQVVQQQKDVSKEKLDQLQADQAKVKSFAELAINKLKQAIIYYKIDVKDLFTKYDTQKDNTLDVNEFQNLLTQMEPNLSIMDILSAFAIFDKDKNYSININEFIEVLQA